MARLLFVVEDTFYIKGRGLVPVPGVLIQGEERFRVGDPLFFQRPDGSCLEWKIGGIEMILASPPRPRNEVSFLFKDLNQEEVPIGTEVWSVDSP